MANVPMKDIQFPGLDDTYTFAQIDNTLTQTGQAADAKKTGDEISELKADFTQLDETAARIDGSYDTMTVGNAKQLVSTVGIEDNAPYLFRTAGGANDIGDREKDTIVGGSVVWNQLVQNGDFSDGTSGWAPYLSANGSIDVSDGTLTYTSATAGSSGYGYGFQRSLQNKPTIGHKYLYCANVRFSMSGVKAAFEFGGSEPLYVAWRELTANTWTNVVYIVSAIASSNRGFMIKPKGGSLEIGSTMTYRNIMLTDLTAKFGTTIADYVYTLESATAGAGVAWLRKYGFFTEDYYNYCEPTIKSVEGLASHRMIGFNQFDKSTVISGAYINDADGEQTTATNSTCTDYIKVVPNQSYYIKSDQTAGAWGAWYDADKNYISGITGYAADGTGKLQTAPSNAHYMRLTTTRNGSGNNDTFCISLHWDGERDGEYEAHKEYTYPLDDSLTLRGIPKLDANNDLYYDGDTYEADGTVTRKYGIVDLGTLNYNIYTNAGSGLKFFYADLPNSASSILQGRPAICSKYVNYTAGETWYQNVPDKQFVAQRKGVSDTPRVWFRDDSFDDKDTFKTAMSGVYLVYELDTPTTETADPFQIPQIVDDWGTEEYVYTDGAFPIPVGHNTFYAANLKAKLEMSPDSPGDGDGDYIVRQTNGLNEYVKMVKELPSAPTTDGSYHLEVTVASGTPTLTWVADE